MPVTAFIATLIQTALLSIAAAGDSFFAACGAFSQQAAAIAVTTVWQGAVVACALAICLSISPRTSAEHRFAIWAAAFVTLVCLPFVVIIANTQASVQSAASFATTVGAAKPLLNIDTRWSLFIAALWVAATFYRAVDLAIHSFRLRKLWREALPVNLECNLSDLLAATKATGKRGPVEVCTTTTLQRPSVIGFFKPRILIPDWLFARLTPGELQQIVLHEAEHLRRYDDWTNLFQKLCLVLFPLNPALVWIERRLCREREMACDDGVIEITRAPRAYAACLTSLAERGLERRAEALSLGAWQRRPELVHRVHSILRRKRTLGPFGTRALLGALGCSLLFGSIELARCPQLIAFVPIRNQALDSGEAKLPAQMNSRRVPAKLLNASYVLPRSTFASRTVSVGKQDAAAVGKTPSYKPLRQSLRPVLLKAEMSKSQTTPPEQQQWVVLTTGEQIQTPDERSGWASSYPTHATKRSRMGGAPSSGARKDDPGWVHLLTYLAVASQAAPNENAGLTADYETGATAEATTSSNAPNSTGTMGNGTVQSKAQPANQITITRLIFRFFPASSSATQPAFVPMRAGWFVIQL